MIIKWVKNVHHLQSIILSSIINCDYEIHLVQQTWKCSLKQTRQRLYRPSNGFSLSSTLFLAASLALSAAASSLVTALGFSFGLFLLTATEDVAPFIDLIGLRGVETKRPGGGPRAAIEPLLLSAIDLLSDTDGGFPELGLFSIDLEEV